ncbi:hypothetical protein SASPL_121119 [Salvia splendens]|uniref:Myb/SANT-like domain-containing protein n=1 Tax=Salvia splendens TaxID=180675 RepID=A0A8X8XUB2_SALSN|nr:hypothetical protein SASPL_121119 [Salvia splendens]
MGDSRRNEIRRGGGGNNQAMGRGRSSHGQGHGDRSRRAWSDREEMHFIASLKELVATRWKADNGFRSGYLFKLEESMRREFPNTDLRVSPHISSKLHTWKKFYSAVSSILERSGVGFNNHDDFKIDCDEHVWSEIIKADSGARFLRYKSWPYYADWKMVFGKDRATGNSAQDTDRANELCASGSRDSNNPGADASQPEGEDVYDGVVDSERRGARKRKRGDALDGLIDVLGKLHEDTNARLDCLSDRIASGLTMSQVFIASDAILARVERLDYFMSLPEGARQPYVWHALEHYTSN